MIPSQTADDAFVYDLGDGRAMLQTVDFFPPMVDDPQLFGEIAAANAISDIYAMGGEPKIAMSLMCFPSCLDISVMKRIMEGAIAKTDEAGVVIAGGHTISDREPKFGLAVTGFADKNAVWSNKGAVPGDKAVLTKKLGVGILNTMIKAGMADESVVRKSLDSMKMLNRRAFETACSFTVHAATDITGFSLMGHLNEMAEGAGLSIEIDSAAVPVFGEAIEGARFGLNPQGMYNNRDFLEDKVAFASSVTRELQDVFFDPQTSGPLALAMSDEDAVRFVEIFGQPAAVIGHFTARKDVAISVL